MKAIAPILPVAGVPDELLKAINDRLRQLANEGGTAQQAQADTSDGAISHCW
jgi:hypothetical protein